EQLWGAVGLAAEPVPREDSETIAASGLLAATRCQQRERAVGSRGEPGGGNRRPAVFSGFLTTTLCAASEDDAECDHRHVSQAGRQIADRCDPSGTRLRCKGAGRGVGAVSAGATRESAAR